MRILYCWICGLITLSDISVIVGFCPFKVSCVPPCPAGSRSSSSFCYNFLPSSTHHYPTPNSSSSSLFESSSGGYADKPEAISDVVVSSTSSALRTASWFSWWSQVILTTVSTVTLLFARSVLSVTIGSSQSSQTIRSISGGSGGFFLAGSGIVLSSISIFWTWGGARLSGRLVRRTATSRIEAANLLRRTITVGVTVNLLGMLVTLLGAEAIIGLLAAKVLTSQGVITSPSMAPQLLQPLDILIVQANTNTLLSHFFSLTSLLYLTRWVSRLDPPSTEDQD